MENQLTKEMHNLLATLDLFKGVRRKSTALLKLYTVQGCQWEIKWKAQKATWIVKWFTEINNLVMCYSSSTTWHLEIDKMGTSTLLYLIECSNLGTQNDAEPNGKEHGKVLGNFGGDGLLAFTTLECRCLHK